MKKENSEKTALKSRRLASACMGLNYLYDQANEKSGSMALLRAAVERGVTLFDNRIGLVGLEPVCYAPVETW